MNCMQGQYISYVQKTESCFLSFEWQRFHQHICLMSIKLVPHTGVRYTTLVTFLTGSLQYHLVTWLYHLPCFLDGTPSATHHITLAQCVVYTSLVSITAATDLMRPCCLVWWKLVCTWKYLFFRNLENFVLFINAVIQNENCTFPYVLSFIFCVICVIVKCWKFIILLLTFSYFVLFTFLLQLVVNFSS